MAITLALPRAILRAPAPGTPASTLFSIISSTLPLLAAILFTATPAMAACTNPDRETGTRIYNADLHVPQYCDDANWIAMGPYPGAGGAGCTAPSAPEGRLYYHHDYRVYQYCDGAEWIALGPLADDVLDGLVGWWKLDDGVTSGDLDDGLVAHWAFDDGSGGAAADSAGGNTGTLTNMDTNNDWVAGKIGSHALDFDGGDDYVAASPVIGDSAAFSVSIWVKTTGTGQATTYSESVVNGGLKMHVRLNDTAAGDIEYCVNDDAATQACINTSDIDINNGQWHHIAAVQESKSLRKLYVDGVQITSNTTTVGTVTPNAATIGNLRISGINYALFPGQLDDVRIYNRALTAAEIARLAGALALDSSGNNNHGALVGMDPATDWTSGQSGGALDFDGDDDYVDFPDAQQTIPDGSDFTITAWVYINNYPSPDTAHIFARNYSGTQNGVAYALGITPGGNIVSAVGNGTEFRSDFYSVPTGQWVFMGAVFDGASITAYRDGVPSGSPAVNDMSGTVPSGNAGASEVIGANYEGIAAVGFFNGQIDDVRIYNRALSDEEIRKIYFASQPVRLDHGLAGHWKMDESGNVSTAADSSGGNDGALTNFPADPSANWITGRVGGALDFDGADDYVVAPDNGNFHFTGGGTVAAWINVDSYAVQSQIVGTADGPVTAGWNLRMRSDGAVEFQQARQTGKKRTMNTSVLQTGQWYHVAATYDSSNPEADPQVYVNGTLSPQNNETGSGSAVNNTNGLFIGVAQNLALELDGRIDDVRVYNRVLTEGEIKKLAAPPPDLEHGLAGHWKLDDGAGSLTAADSSGNGNDGSLTNMDETTDWVAGRVGGALDFDAANDEYIHIGNQTELAMGTGDFTVTAWIKTSTADDMVIAQKRSDLGGSGAGWIFNIRPNGGLRVQSFSDGTNVSSNNNISNRAVNDGQWHHVVLLVDRANDILDSYIDGVRENTNIDISSVTGSVDNSYSFRIGRSNHSTGWPFNGRIDDVRLYNRVLSDEEIRKLANPINLESGLVGHWKLDESGNVSTAADSSGQGNDGALTNFPADPSASWVTGRVGGALDFDGANELITVPDDPSLQFGMNDFSIAAWVYPRDLTHAECGDCTRIMSKDNYPTAWWAVDLLDPDTDDAAGIEFEVSDDSANTCAATSAGEIVPLNEWTHIVIVKDRNADTTRFYANGFFDSSVSSPGCTDTINITSTPLHLSGWWGELNGNLDDVRVYNRALNADEIKFLSSPCQNPGRFPGTMLYNYDHAVLQYCNGENWIGIGK